LLPLASGDWLDVTQVPGVMAARDGAGSLLAALVYADLFDYSLTLQELVRYQVGTSFTAGEVTHLLTSRNYLRHMVVEREGHYALRGKEQNFRIRALRRRISALLWRRYSLYHKYIAAMPFVRMVAVTGALAVNNVDARPDIDLLVVAEAGRVWICRRFLVILVRIASLFGDEICPNYVISSDRLQLQQQDFFTAQELAQMVPVHGHYT
jgi:hypothetical protein